MLTDEQIERIIKLRTPVKIQTIGGYMPLYPDLDVKNAIREALVEDEKQRAISGQQFDEAIAGLAIATKPTCTLPLKEGEYAPEFDVALGEWVYPKYKRCRECEKRTGAIVIHDLAEQLHSAGLSALECPKCYCADTWHDYRKRIAGTLCEAVNK